MDRKTFFAAVSMAACTIAVFIVFSKSLAAAEAAACKPGDQLPCACDPASSASANPTVTPCFVGDPNRQTFVQTDSYAANVFAAVSWPLGARKGEPDYAAELKGDYTTVWDSWKSTREIFRMDGDPPVAWDSDERALPSACRNMDLEAERAKYPGGNAIPTTLSPRLLDEYVNPEGHALIDASGEPVRYEVLMNRQAYDYTVDNQLWDVAALDEFLVANGKLELPMGDWNIGDSTQTRGAIVAKAAWKLLDPAKDDFGNFHTSWAYVTPLVVDGALSHACALRPVGLVGLHLALKLKSQPDWLWTSFEHRAVAPLWSEIGPSTMPPELSHLPNWLFYSNAQKGVARLNKPADEPSAGAPSRIVRFYPAGYYYPPVVPGMEPDCATSMEFKCFNERLAAGLKDSVVRNYMLIGAQWRTPNNQDSQITPEVLGNATLESFTQTSSSCIACHSYAKAKNTRANPGSLDFIFSYSRDVLERASPAQAEDDLPQD